MAGPTQAPPRQPRFIDVITGLRDFALVTYAVAPEKLAALLPDGFEPEVFTLNNGKQCALISAAMFHDVDFHPAFASWPKFSFEQTNYRAYVRRGSERCAWFFGTALHTPFVMVPRYVWGLPWHYVNIDITSTWIDGRCDLWRYTSWGKWGAARVDLVGTAEPTATLDGFADDEETALILTHPLVGYYRRTDNKVGTYSIWHDRLHMQRAIVQQAKFEVFEKLGLIDSHTKPHSALIQRQADFIIYLPPKSV